MNLDQLEEDLMKSITNSLEEHGYLPRIRAQLKVNALRKAQELESKGTIANSDEIKPKKLDGEDDAAMIELCRQLFEFCGLKETAEMLKVEIDQNGQHIDPASRFPQINANSEEPALLQLVSKAK
ncbi:hypothetical protein TRFO_24648 [Tritrichomonas foetus]|uniref:LisH domain-containing protein n=1 Tax=Tritrichomonas foetus TaxID=1144522 RepID=A0A1J4KC24_9EUKA|nr:hypothetical protein TRFO_24648 [Tritrichomonas foetus]|eukprot:OHT07244.1 hypothetical protein TRFO_24648 [Tritrichomonas foetus]